MSQRHDEAFEEIRREYDDVVVALTAASRGTKRGAPGVPAFDPKRLEPAIVTAGDAYALLLIATAEGYLRQYLQSVGAAVRDDAGLSQLIDQSAAELNRQLNRTQLRPRDRDPMHLLRVTRNEYAHGHRTGGFPSVPTVQAIVSRFLHPFP
jgi:hypothetical protein